MTLPRVVRLGTERLLVREYLVEWRGSTRMDWDWLTVESRNRGGDSGPWWDYEAAIMRQYPSRATQLARYRPTAHCWE